MSWKPVRNDLYKHKGIDLIYSFDISDDIGDSFERVVFEYKDVSITFIYNSKEIKHYNLVPCILEAIDMYGKEGYELFEKYFKEYISYKNKYIVLENTIYKHDVHIGKLDNKSLYYREIEMKDGKKFDHSSYWKTFDQNDFTYQFSSKRTFESIKLKVLDYYNENKILPLDKYILKDKTEEYNAIKKWFLDSNFTHFKLENEI